MFSISSLALFSTLAVSFCFAFKADPWDEFGYLTPENPEISFCRSRRFKERKSSCESEYDEAKCRCLGSSRNNSLPAASEAFNHRQSTQSQCIVPHLDRPLNYSNYQDQAENKQWPPAVCGLQLVPIKVPQPNNRSQVRRPETIIGVKCMEIPHYLPGWHCVPLKEAIHEVRVHLFEIRENQHELVRQSIVKIKMPSACHMALVNDSSKCGSNKYWNSDAEACRCRRVYECRQMEVWSHENCRCECGLMNSQCQPGHYVDQQSCVCRRSTENQPNPSDCRYWFCGGIFDLFSFSS